MAPRTQMHNDARQEKITPCQTRHGVEGSRVTSRTFEGRAFAKYGLLSREITIASRLVARPIHCPRLPPAFLYTFHRTNLIIRSVFAAYFDCEILHLAFVWRFGSFTAGMPKSERPHEFGAVNFLCTNRMALFHDAETALGNAEIISTVVSTTEPYIDDPFRIEHLNRVLTSNFLLNYLNFTNVFKECCTKLIYTYIKMIN